MAVEDHGFFDELGGGILISKKQEKLRKEIIDSTNHTSLNTLEDKIKKRIRNVQPMVEEIPNKYNTKIQQSKFESARSV